MPENEDKKHLTCDHCGGRLMRSRDWIVTGYPYWLRPWGSSLKMTEVVIPHACLRCGRVTYILRDLHLIKRDYEKLSDEEKEEAFSSSLV